MENKMQRTKEKFIKMKVRKVILKKKKRNIENNDFIREKGRREDMQK